MPLTYFKRFRMEIDLGELPFSEPPLPEGYSLIPWSLDQLQDHAEAKYLSFCSEVDAIVFPCLGEREGCRRLMGEISQKQTFLPMATWLLRYESPYSRKWENCGTVQGICDRRSRGSIQNLGITPLHRNRNLGTCLMYRALDGFRASGLKRATLEVTAQNSGAIRLYERLGFATVRTVYKAVELAYS